MDIVIFKEVTTEGVLASIEENSKKYHDGLYADMSNLPERTMVKKGAAEIGDIIKVVKASGVKLRKSKIAEVNTEEKLIIERLEAANLPFTKLIDAYNVERKKILDDEKRVKAMFEAQEKLLAEHEEALLLNKVWDLEADQREQQRKQAEIDRENEIKERERIAVEREKQAILDAQQRERDAVEAERLRREANTEHKASINNAIMRDVMRVSGIDENQAKAIVVAMAKKEITNTTINY